MKLETLHIVSLDVPVPADYGGVIDIYFRAKAVKALGVKVILHCFEYGRNAKQDFSEIADEVYFYKRKRSILDNLKTDPFIVASRKSQTLVNRLLLDNHPILMEGHHCAGLLNDSKLLNRKKFVRIHNIEWIYYKALSESSKSTWRKTFFKGESKKLKKFDTSLAKADGLFCLSTSELTYYKKINPSSYLWPVGCDLENELSIQSEKYTLFHGNLSVAENEKALRWIIGAWEKNQLTKTLIVAGKNPKSDLKKLLAKHAFVKLIENPSNEKMTELIRAAEVNLLITFQSTGVKLKLLNALSQGKKCIANPLMIEGTDLGQFCHVIDDQDKLADVLRQECSFQTEELLERINYLNQHYNTVKNTKEVLEIIESKLF